MRGYRGVEESYYFMPKEKFILKEDKYYYAQAPYYQQEWPVAWREIDDL